MIEVKHFIFAFLLSLFLSGIEIFILHRKYIYILYRTKVFYYYLIANGIFGLTILLLHFFDLKFILTDNIWTLAIISGVGIHFLLNGKLFNLESNEKQILFFYNTMHEQFFSNLKSLLSNRVNDYKHDISKLLESKYSREDIIARCKEYICSHFENEEKARFLQEFSDICEKYTTEFEITLFFVNIADDEYIKRLIND